MEKYTGIEYKKRHGSYFKVPALVGTFFSVVRYPCYSDERGAPIALS
jgi:hypothetical protein